MNIVGTLIIAVVIHIAAKLNQFCAGLGFTGTLECSEMPNR